MSDIEENSVEETEEVGASTTEERDGKEQGSAIEQKPEKKYTDADVDRIVSKRLNREREKLSKALGEGQKESELEIRERKVLERELSIEVREKLEKDKLPQSLSKLMNYSSAERGNHSRGRFLCIWCYGNRSGNKTRSNHTDRG